MAKKVLTRLEKDYNKERDRIRKQISRMESRGYEFPTKDIIFPPRPKTITQADLLKLKALDTQALYDNAVFYNRFTGDVETGRQGKITEKSKEYRRLKQEYESKADTEPDTTSFADTVLENFLVHIGSIFQANPPIYVYIKRWYDANLARLGKEDFAEILESAQNAGMWPGWECISDEERLYGKLDAILALGVSPGYIDDVNSETSIVSLLENAEDWGLPE